MSYTRLDLTRRALATREQEAARRAAEAEAAAATQSPALLGWSQPSPRALVADLARRDLEATREAGIDYGSGSPTRSKRRGWSDWAPSPDASLRYLGVPVLRNTPRRQEAEVRRMKVAGEWDEWARQARMNELRAELRRRGITPEH